MEDALVPLERKHKSILKEAQKVNRFIKEKENKRLEEREHEIEEQKKLKERIEQFQKAVANLPVSRSTKRGIIKDIPTGYYGSSSTYSLMALGGDKFTNWRFGNEIVNLSRTYRYLCLHENKGKIGWVRVVDTRITFIGQGVDKAGTVYLNEIPCKLGFTSIWDDDDIANGNLVITIKPPYSSVVLKLKTWFSIDNFNINEIPKITNADTPRLGSIKRYIKDKKDEFKEKILEIMLHRFQYTTNLYGVQANKFFGPVYTTCKLRLAKIQENPVIIISEI